MSDVYILGINVSHDISAALLKNGQVLYAISEERLNRIKRYTGGIDAEGMTSKHLPKESIQYCLDAAKVHITDVDLFVVSTSIVASYLDYRTRDLEREEILRQFPEEVDPQKVHIVGHHLGHAASAFYPSGFKDAAIIIADGGGNLFSKKNDQTGQEEQYEERVSIYHGHDKDIDLLMQCLDGVPSSGYLSNKKHCSLGDFYQSATMFIGFKTGDEGKTMGLAPYGTDRLYKDFMDAVHYENGELSIQEDYQFNKWNDISKEFYSGRFGQPRKPWEPLRQVDKDVAAAVQYVLEEVLIKIANDAYQKTQSKNLCLAGGIALNSVANKKILDNTPFENIFVQPAASDDGCALGNALLGWVKYQNNPSVWEMRNAYLGRSYSDEEIVKAIEKNRFWCSPIKAENVVKKTSELLSKKNIIGWFQGGSEFGPRALGHRSILCDTRFPDMKDVLNRRVKHREMFRPFAPVILAEHNSDYFELDCPSPFMLLIAKVVAKQPLPAITHVDNTARVQTITQADNGIYYEVVKAYYELTGVPVILNTSFNVAGEPIVETPEDAIYCFISTNINYLVLGDIILRKHPLRCLILKTWPQDIKRISYTKLRNFYKRFPCLSYVKKKFEFLFVKKQPENVKVPG